METIRIKDILENGQFTVQGKHRIIRYLGIEYQDRTVAEWDSEDGELPPRALMDHEIVAIHVTEDGYMEIEYDGDEYMGNEDFGEE